MDTPELEFLQWLVDRFIKAMDLDTSEPIQELLDKLADALTPMGGG